MLAFKRMPTRTKGREQRAEDCDKHGGENAPSIRDGPRSRYGMGGDVSSSPFLAYRGTWWWVAAMEDMEKVDLSANGSTKPIPMGWGHRSSTPTEMARLHNRAEEKETATPPDCKTPLPPT